ncbi:hypothetical protein [Roseiconus lacunae]|uniref:hypothetical protein n=1 Tax=Roseiconus lacunae TaxID=2605694 RepID=UPI0011F15B6B|nr:hypothetical protein [Roseiconus lacunae]
MTIKNAIRKKLRRFALFCLVTASTAVTFNHGRLQAEDTHDSGALCGWVDDLSHETSSPSSNPSPNPLAKAHRKSNTIRPNAEPPVPQFLSITIGEELFINTCNYEQWLAGTLQDQDPKAAIAVNESNDELAVTPNPPAKTNRGSRTAADFNSTVAAIAAAASAGNPIAFTHWTEPFAMVGPFAKPAESLWQPAVVKTESVATQGEAKRSIVSTDAQVAAIAAWIDQTKAFVTTLSDQDFRVFIEGLPGATDNFEVADETIDVLALNDDVEDDSAVVSQLADGTDLASIDDLDGSDARSHIGSGPMIFTIEDTYASYDLAKEDRVAAAPVKDLTEPTADEHATPVLVWSDMLPSPQRQPLCFRSFAEQCDAGWSPKADRAVPSWQRRLLPTPSTDTVAVNTTAINEAEKIPPESETMTTDKEVVAENTTVNAIESSPAAAPGYWAGSPECWLDVLISKADEAAQLQQVVRQSLRPRRVGSELASLVVSGDGVASQLADRLAQAWPAAPAPAIPKAGSGAKLLARAEAAERSESESPAEAFSDEQLAQVGATLLQWVDVAQSVIDDMNDRIEDVAEVARSRGTQDDSQLR